MKKIYITSRGPKIEFVSGNLKACYDSLKDSLRPFELQQLKSYVQVSRIVKKVGKYHFMSHFGTTAVIEKHQVYSSYQKLLLKLAS